MSFPTEKETELALASSHIPDPKFDEDHNLHLETHSLVTGNMEMERHKKFHMAMQAQKQPQVQQGTPVLPQGAPGQGSQPKPPPATNQAGVTTATMGTGG